MIPDYLARRRVNVVVLTQVSDMMAAYDQELTTRDDGKIVWRVPVWFTSISRGRIGIVGVLDVDATTGEVIYTDDDLEHMRQETLRLLEQIGPENARRTSES